MNKEELKLAVNEYFTEHLDCDYWSGLSDKIRNAGVTMAITVIQGVLEFELEELTEDDYLVIAIAEQAVFIVRNHEEFQEGKVPVSESVEGISNSYALINDDVTISRIAQRYIDRARRRRMIGSLRLGRG